MRFRGKVMLGFAVVLVISAVTMGIAYLGFERVSSGVATYRKSVSEADLARNIDRELISYRALARYYVVTGKEDDATAALTAEASLKEAVTQSMRGTTNSARIDQVTRLGREFQTFTKIFADTYAAKNIRMNNVLPGWIDSLPATEARRDSVPMRRYGAADEIAATIAFLVSNGAAYITGQNLKVDGGLTRSI